MTHPQATPPEMEDSVKYWPGLQADSSFSPPFHSEEPPSPSPIATPSPVASPSLGVTITSAPQSKDQVEHQVAESTVTSINEGGGDGDRDGGDAQEKGSAEVEKEEVRAQEIGQEEEKNQTQPPQPIQEEVKKETEEQERETTSTGGTGRRPSLHHTASPIRVQRNGACSHSTTSGYELSLDLKNKQVGSKALWDCRFEDV